MVRLVGAILGIWLMSVPAAAQTVAQRVAEASRAQAAAISANDIDARLRLYRPDARSMPDYQPALHGTGEIEAYQRALLARRRVTRYEQVPGDTIDLGDAAVETGSFTIAWRLADGSTQEERGKYANVWAVEPGGGVKLKADIWGYFRPLPDPSAFFVAMPESAPAPGPVDPKLAEELNAKSAAMATAVRAHDPAPQIAMYTDDAIFMPFAMEPKAGIAAIREHLTTYVNAGRGAAFDSVEVWNTGFERHGGWVIEYPKFRVRWRAGDQSGVAKGGGVRLWRREPDGSLKLHRQIGTHDAQ